MRVGQNVTHRADGRWEARYIRERSMDGKAVYGFCYGKTREEAVLKCEDAERLQKNSAVKSPKCFRDVFAMWMNAEHAEDSAKPAESYVLPVIGDIPVTMLTDRELSELMKSIKAACSSSETKKCFDLLAGAMSFALNEDFLIVSPIGTETLKYQSGRKIRASRNNMPLSECDYLTAEQARVLEGALLEGIDGRRSGACIGLYLCLHLGLTCAEAGALQLKDIDLKRRTLSVNKVAVKPLSSNGGVYELETASIEERILPLPHFIYKFIHSVKDRCPTPASFLVYNKSGAQCQSAEYIRELGRINEAYHIAPKLDLKMLRETFIVRCIKSGIDMPTVMKLVGIDNINDFWTRYGSLFATQTEDICKLDSYKAGTSHDRPDPAKLNLLILGAGGYGHTVKEIAEKIGIFDRIAFLDDNPSVTEAIDTCTNAPRYRCDFPCAYPAIGDCKRRAELIAFLEKSGYIVPRIIHPSVMISPSASVESGVIIEANVTVNAMAEIKKGCIISSNALIDRGAVVSEAVHVDSSSTVAKDAVVPPLTRVESGTVYAGGRTAPRSDTKKMNVTDEKLPITPVGDYNFDDVM